MAIGNFLTTRETAEIVGVSENRIRQFAVDGRLPGQRIGIQLFFDRDVVRKFSKKPRKNGRPKEKSENG